MKKSKNITGLKKTAANLRILTGVFFHFVPELFRGKIPPREYFAFSIRLLVLLKSVQHNKFVESDKKIKIDLYIPEYPSKAFFYSCEKFKVFGMKMPATTTLISVTNACKFKCSHCYQRMDKGEDIDIKILTDTVKKISQRGVAFFNIEGGDPFIKYDRLKKVCEAVGENGEIWVNSTGDGITTERLIELKKYNLRAIMFSMHEPDPDSLNAFMGREDAWETLEKGILLCSKAGIMPTLNSCLKKEDFVNGKFEKVMEKSKELGVALIQLIVPKPSGAWLGNESLQFSEEELKIMKAKVKLYNSDRKYKDYPSISAQAVEEDADHYGCTAGGTERFYVNAKGDVQPCEFLNISFGNIGSEDFDIIYDRMREQFSTCPECWLCEKKGEEIYRIYTDNKMTTLPLPPEYTAKIFGDIKEYKETEFYKKIDKIK